MPDATFATPDVTTFCRLDELGLLHGHRGRSTDPLYRARRPLHTGADLLTDRQQQRLTALFGDEDHIQVQATWGI